MVLMLGGFVGGWVIFCVGFKCVLWLLVLVMYLFNVVFLLLVLIYLISLVVVSVVLVVEQFGYGLGFMVYLMYMILVVEGENKIVYYVICMGFMVLGMMILGMWSGWLQDYIGYVFFFGWVLVVMVLSFVMVVLICVFEDFGKKEDVV